MAKQNGSDSGGGSDETGSVEEKVWTSANFRPPLVGINQELVRELHLVLEAAPEIKGAVNAGVIFDFMCRIVRERLTAVGVLEELEKKAPVDILLEGRQILNEKAAAAKGDSEAKQAGVGGPATSVSGDGPTVETNETVKRGTEFPDLKPGAKVIASCREPGTCISCTAAFEAKVRIVYEPGESGEKGRTWGPRCCEASRYYHEQYAKARV